MKLQLVDVSDYDKFLRMIRTHGDILDVLNLKKDGLEFARKKLAALEHAPGAEADRLVD
jgi:hypothetical protein